MTENQMSVCIFGLSSSGKTTLARLFVERLREKKVPCALIDGDEIRELFEVKYGHDANGRMLQSKRILRLASWVEKQGIIPVIAMIHPFQEDRDLFKDKLSNYFQAYLKCDIEKCAKRDEKISKGVYALRQIKERPQVVGHDIPFHEPSSVDITLDSDNKEASVLLEEIWEEFWNRFTQNK